MKMEQTECSETSAYKIQTPGNYPEGNIQHTEHSESLKSKSSFCCESEYVNLLSTGLVFDLHVTMHLDQFCYNKSNQLH
jgi:hypothetical protein